MTRSFFCFLIALSCFSCQPSLSSGEVLEAKNRIRTEKILYTESPSRNRYFLSRVATNQDLVLLCEADHPFVRYYAYSILADRNYPGLKEIFETHRDDQSKIPFSNSACLSGEWKLSELMLRELGPDFEFGYTEKEYNLQYDRLQSR